MSYYWNRIFQFLWAVILIFDFGIKAIEGVDLVDHQLLYGFQPTLYIIMFGQDLREKGFGISTAADLWIGLFPVSMALVYFYLKAKCDAQYALYGSNAFVEKQKLIKRGYDRNNEIELQGHPNDYLKEGGDAEGAPKEDRGVGDDNSNHNDSSRKCLN